MSPAEPFPLYFPGDARRPFSSEDATRRFAKVAQLEEGGARAGAGLWSVRLGQRVLAQEFGCSVVAADADETLLTRMRERVQSLGLDGRVEVRTRGSAQARPRARASSTPSSPGPDVCMALPDALGTCGPCWPARAGSGITYPVRVGRVHASRRPRVLGAAPGRLRCCCPASCCRHFGAAGFEPESVESLQDAELDALYRGARAHLARRSVRAVGCVAARGDGRCTGQSGKATRQLRVRWWAAATSPGEKPPGPTRVTASGYPTLRCEGAGCSVHRAVEVQQLHRLGRHAQLHLLAVARGVSAHLEGHGRANGWCTSWA